MNKIKLSVLFVMSMIPVVLFAQGWSLQVSGQYGFIRYGDYNNYVDYWNANHDASLYPRMEKINSMAGAGIEVTKQMSRFQVGIGVGYLALETIDYQSGVMESKTNPEVDLKHTANTTFVQVLGRYDVLRFGSMTAYAGGGISYYLTNLTFDEGQAGYLTYSDLHDITRNSQTDMEANRFGLNGFLGMEYLLSKRISLALRFTGRLAKIGGFVGTQNWDEVDIGPTKTITISETRGAYLVYSESDDGSISYTPREDGPWLSGEREGKLDLSGIGIEIGVRIAFPE